VQEHAFALLDRQRLTHVAEYLVNETNCDELAFEWEHIDAMARRFKQHLRPLLRAVDLSATRVNAPIQEAISFLKTAFQHEGHWIDDTAGESLLVKNWTPESSIEYNRSNSVEKVVVAQK